MPTTHNCTTGKEFGNSYLKKAAYITLQQETLASRKSNAFAYAKYIS